MKKDPSTAHHGGVIHTYQKYDPQQFPSPTAPPPDLVSPALEHLLYYGDRRELTEEELARAVRLDPSRIAGLGPSIDALLAILRERKRKILAKYETESVQLEARTNVDRRAARQQPPKKFRKSFEQAIRHRQLYDLERIWYAIGRDQDPFARQLVPLMEAMGQEYQIDELASKYDFTGSTSLNVPEALEVKAELERIDQLIEQLEEAARTAQIALIDMEALAEFAEPGDLQRLEALKQYVEDYLREVAERQGLERDGGAFRLTPKAYRVFQGKLLQRIFSDLQAARSGRHQDLIVGEGAVELESTKPYEFGDSVAHLDMPQTMINAMLREGQTSGLRLRSDDMVIHRTRNSPKCATAVIMDMSGSMRYDAQYANVKRMALALDGLIRSEYPGDYLQFIEMYSFAQPRPSGEIVELLPKPVVIHDPIVRLKVDMSRDDVSETQIPPHFTNIQHALRLARQFLASRDTPNRQIVLITDGLPTAHFDGPWLYLLYPPDPLTEAATMREAEQCRRENIVINMFLVPSWSQSEEDIRFANRLSEQTKGRVFFTAGKDLDRFVVWDYVHRRREILG